VFAFVRRHVHSAEEAQDLTQGFFTRMLDKRDLGKADRDRGRFRSFLLAACRHFMCNEWDRRRAIKRGGGVAAIPIDVLEAEGRYERALTNTETPERLYDREWCLTLLKAVLDRLREEYESAGNERVFDRLSGFLTADDDGTHADAAADLDMTIGAVKVAVHRMRRRYRQALRQHVADTVATDGEVDDEMRFLLRTLTGQDV
jgi:RNA polymerase sigma-70 factor (ECF subfamily)